MGSPWHVVCQATKAACLLACPLEWHRFQRSCFLALPGTSALSSNPPGPLHCSITTSIAVYASVCKELGLPMRCLASRVGLPASIPTAAATSSTSVPPDAREQAHACGVASFPRAPPAVRFTPPRPPSRGLQVPWGRGIVQRLHRDVRRRRAGRGHDPLCYHARMRQPRLQRARQPLGVVRS